MSACPYIPYFGTPGVCRGCGKPLPQGRRAWCSDECSDAYQRAHIWASARQIALRRDGHRCVTCGSTSGLEVNHIDPRVGAGYLSGCWNHPENLETLCHDCHVKVTNAQMAARRSSGFVQESLDVAPDAVGSLW